jgi:hypothetical protein
MITTFKHFEASVEQEYVCVCVCVCVCKSRGQNQDKRIKVIGQQISIQNKEGYPIR